MAVDSVIIKGVSIKKGDIVEVKFKKLDDVLDFYKQYGYRINEILDKTKYCDHLASVTNGGIFLVDSVSDSNFYLPEIREKNASRNQKVDRPSEITIVDQNSDNTDDFRLNEHVIESIEVKDNAGDRYFSDKFQLSLVKIDGLLVINGVTLDKDDKALIDILEKTIADMSIRAMLESDDEVEKER